MNFSATHHLYDMPYPLFARTVVIMGANDATAQDATRARQLALLYLMRGQWRVVVEDTWAGISGAVRRFEDRRIWAVSKHEFESIMQSAVVERVGALARAA